MVIFEELFVYNMAFSNIFSMLFHKVNMDGGQDFPSNLQLRKKSYKKLKFLHIWYINDSLHDIFLQAPRQQIPEKSTRNGPLPP